MTEHNLPAECRGVIDFANCLDALTTPKPLSDAERLDRADALSIHADRLLAEVHGLKAREFELRAAAVSSHAEAMTWREHAQERHISASRLLHGADLAEAKRRGRTEG